MWHKPCWTFHPWCPCIKTRCLSVNLITSHFSNFADYRQLQIPNARTKYYEILPAHTKTTHDTTNKIVSLYFEFKYHYSTLQNKFRLLLNKGVDRHKYLYFFARNQLYKTNVFKGPKSRRLELKVGSWTSGYHSECYSESDQAERTWQGYQWFRAILSRGNLQQLCHGQPSLGISY